MRESWPNPCLQRTVPAVCSFAIMATSASAGIVVFSVGGGRSNAHGLESAKPDFQSLFKEPVGLPRPESRAGARRWVALLRPSYADWGSASKGGEGHRRATGPGVERCYAARGRGARQGADAVARDEPVLMGPGRAAGGGSAATAAYLNDTLQRTGLRTAAEFGR